LLASVVAFLAALVRTLFALAFLDGGVLVVDGFRGDALEGIVLGDIGNFFLEVPRRLIVGVR